MEQRYAASVVIYNSDGRVLLARRAPTKFPFPNVLSLPSTYARDLDGRLVHEKPSDEIIGRQLCQAVKRKLGIDVTLLDVIGEKQGQQAHYLLHMRDFIARVSGGEIRPNGKDFSEAAWYNPVETLGGKDRSRMGFCTQVLLEALDRDPNFWRAYT